jgi:hypothetical protein
VVFRAPMKGASFRLKKFVRDWHGGIQSLLL